MRVVFFGTPAFAVPSLDALCQNNIDVAAVVTQPDRPSGRSHSRAQLSPVKQRAIELGIAVWQPERPRGPDFLDQMRGTDAEIGIVVAYGHLLPRELLAIPRLGFVNVHASLLPRWRGAAPIQWAILSGDEATGVSIMRVDPALDAGAVWQTRSIPIAANDTAGSLTARLAQLGADALIEALPTIVNGQTPVAQAEDRVTIAPKIGRETARIDWSRPAIDIDRLIRAMDPAPGAWSTLNGEPVKLFASDDLSPAVATRTDDVGGVAVVEGSVRVMTRAGVLTLGDVQPAGRKRLSAMEWLRGTRSSRGDSSTRFE